MKRDNPHPRLPLEGEGVGGLPPGAEVTGDAVTGGDLIIVKAVTIVTLVTVVTVVNVVNAWPVMWPVRGHIAVAKLLPPFQGEGRGGDGSNVRSGTPIPIPAFPLKGKERVGIALECPQQFTSSRPHGK